MIINLISNLSKQSFWFDLLVYNSIATLHYIAQNPRYPKQKGKSRTSRRAKSLLLGWRNVLSVSKKPTEPWARISLIKPWVREWPHEVQKISKSEKKAQKIPLVKGNFKGYAPVTQDQDLIKDTCT